MCHISDVGPKPIQMDPSQVNQGVAKVHVLGGMNPDLDATKKIQLDPPQVNHKFASPC